jgi:hypothetical protein
MLILLQFMKSSPPEQALQYFERAADSGNAVAMAFLGKYPAEKRVLPPRELKINYLWDIFM